MLDRFGRIDYHFRYKLVVRHPAPRRRHPMLYTADRPPQRRLSGRPAFAFTLVELLVVLGIIVLLISIAIPALSTAREASRRAVCASNLRQLAQGIFAYATDHDSALPVH